MDTDENNIATVKTDSKSEEVTNEENTETKKDKTTEVKRQIKNASTPKKPTNQIHSFFGRIYFSPSILKPSPPFILLSL